MPDYHQYNSILTPELTNVNRKLRNDPFILLASLLLLDGVLSILVSLSFMYDLFKFEFTIFAKVYYRLFTGAERFWYLSDNFFLSLVLESMVICAILICLPAYFALLPKVDQEYKKLVFNSLLSLYPSIK